MPTPTRLSFILLCMSFAGTTVADNRSVQRDMLRWAEVCFANPTEATAKQPFALELRRQDHGRLGRNQSVIGTSPITIGRQRFEHGLGTHANSDLLFTFPAGSVRSFNASVGIDNNHDTDGQRGSAIFSVEVSRKESFRSEVLRGGQEPVKVSVDVPDGADSLVLKVSTPDEPSHDHADWADARLVKTDGTVLWLDQIEPIVPAPGPPFSFMYDGQASRILLRQWEHQTQRTESDGRVQRRAGTDQPRERDRFRLRRTESESDSAAGPGNHGPECERRGALDQFTFTVHVDAQAPGPVAGTVSLFSDAPNAAPFQFGVAAQVGVKVVDNDDPGFYPGGAGSDFTFYADPRAYGGDIRYHAKGTGANYVDYEFTGLTDGQHYQIATTWTTGSSRASNARFEVYDLARTAINPATDTADATVRVDQRIAPDDFQYDGEAWENLAIVQLVGSESLTVRVYDDGDNWIYADAVRIEQVYLPTALAAIQDATKKIAIVSATPDHLKQLAADPAALQAFWRRGGTVVLCGLTPEGLADYNRIVGVEHVIRPFKRQRVTFPPLRNPLTAGLTVGDIVMLSGQRIFGWTADEYVASDVFTQVVDLDDMAPFAKSDFPSYDNIVNGFVGSDGWPLIIDFPYPQDGQPYEIQLDLPSEETIVEYTHDQSVNYSPTTRIALLFDGKDRVEFELNAGGDAQTFAINPPRRARRVTVQVVQWQPDPTKGPNIGIDNIALKVQRSPEWQATVKPMLNLGGLVQYVKGNGGVVLCNLNFLDSEAVPINQTKKRTILATVLRNLKAPFSGGRTVIAGGNLACVPLDIHTKATTYKTKLRPLIRHADLYHIFPRPDGKHWDGIEYYDPEAKKGVVYIFKPAAQPDTMTVRLRGLQRDTRYRVTFEDGSNLAVDKSGRELIAGIEVTLQGERRSELMFFEVIAPAMSTDPSQRN